MTHFKPSCLLVSLLTTLLLLYAVAASATPSSPVHQLQTRIHNLRNSLNQDQNQQQNLQNQLKKTETNMGNMVIQIQQTQQKIKEEQRALANSNKMQSEQQKLLNSQTDTLAKQARAIYMLEKQNYFQIMLNQEDPEKMSRILTYYSYINRQRLQLIQQFQETLQQITVNKKNQQANLQQLEKLEQQQQKQQHNFLAMQQQRQKVLQTLNNRITGKHEQLRVLIANKNALERVVSHLENSYLSIHKMLPIHRNGKFPWPTAGRITQSFGASIEQSQLKSTGILIKAAAGQPVYAIAGGRVVFAKWMSGYGLLLIIDHGNGLMSIYGHNYSLYKKKGDSVKTGDLIATVGNSGGYQQTALYFALRQNGTPIDPAQWCG